MTALPAAYSSHLLPSRNPTAVRKASPAAPALQLGCTAFLPPRCTPWLALTGCFGVMVSAEDALSASGLATCCRLLTALGWEPARAGESLPHVLSTPRLPSHPASLFFSHSLHLLVFPHRLLLGLACWPALSSLFGRWGSGSAGPLCASAVFPASDAKGKAVSLCNELPGLSGAMLVPGGVLPTVLRNCRVFNFQGAREHWAPAYQKQEREIK